MAQTLRDLKIAMRDFDGPAQVAPARSNARTAS